MDWTVGSRVKTSYAMNPFLLGSRREGGCFFWPESRRRRRCSETSVNLLLLQMADDLARIILLAGFAVIAPVGIYH